MRRGRCSERRRKAGQLEPGQERGIFSPCHLTGRWVFMRCCGRGGATPPLQFPPVIGAILQVYTRVFTDQRILSFLGGTEIWHKLGWGMGVCCREQLQTLPVRCSFLQTHRSTPPSSSLPASIMIVCVNGRYKHRRCDKPGFKISRDKVKDAVSPKAKRKTSACAASSLPVSVKSSPTV